MSFIANLLNKAGVPSTLCKSSAGHFYMGGNMQRSSAVLFQTIDEFNKFVDELKEMHVDSPLIHQYDLDVFGLVNGQIQFDLIKPKTVQ